MACKRCACDLVFRPGTALNTNVHFHTLVAQGVFIVDAEGTRRNHLVGVMDTEPYGFVPSDRNCIPTVWMLVGSTV